MTAVTAPDAAGFLAVRRATARRSWIVVAGFAAALAALLLLALMLGDYTLSPAGVVRALFGGGTMIDQYVVWQVRLPRAVLAALAGAALGLAGALFQTMLRNPLASPDLLGISGGASVGAVFATLILGATGLVITGFAFAGAIAVAIVLMIAARNLADGGYRLVLAGIAIAFLCVAVVGYLMKRAQLNEASAAIVWITGSIGATTWEAPAVIGIVLLLALPGTMILSRLLPVTALGEAAARGLGVSPPAVRAGAVVLAVLLAASTVSFIGPVGFVALCAPPIARVLVGRGAVALAASGVAGAAILLAADLAAQFAFPGVIVPVGVVTGAVGAPYLLWLLAHPKGRRI